MNGKHTSYRTPTIPASNTHHSLAFAATSTSSLLSALLSVRSTPPRIIQSPPTQPRRASVALVLRLTPPEGLKIPEEEWGVGLGLDEFFKLRESESESVLLAVRLKGNYQLIKDVYFSLVQYSLGISPRDDPSDHVHPSNLPPFRPLLVAHRLPRRSVRAIGYFFPLYSVTGDVGRDRRGSGREGIRLGREVGR